MPHRLYADEQFPRPVVDDLRARGHDVLTAHDDGRANQGIDDADVLARATALGRAVLTGNRWDYHRLHNADPNHAGMVTCTDDDMDALADNIHAAIATLPDLVGRCVRVTKPNVPPP